MPNPIATFTTTMGEIKCEIFLDQDVKLSLVAERKKLVAFESVIGAGIVVSKLVELVRHEEPDTTPVSQQELPTCSICIDIPGKGSLLLVDPCLECSSALMDRVVLEVLLQ